MFRDRLSFVTSASKETVNSSSTYSGHLVEVHIQWTHHGLTVDLQWTYSEHTVDLRWTYSGHTVDIQWTYSGHTGDTVDTVDIKWTCSGRAGDTQWTHSGHTVDTQWTYSEHTVDLQWTWSGLAVDRGCRLTEINRLLDGEVQLSLDSPSRFQTDPGLTVSISWLSHGSHSHPDSMSAFKSWSAHEV